MERRRRHKIPVSFIMTQPLNKCRNFSPQGIQFYGGGLSLVKEAARRTQSSTESKWSHASSSYFHVPGIFISPFSCWSQMWHRNLSQHSVHHHLCWNHFIISDLVYGLYSTIFLLCLMLCIQDLHGCETQNTYVSISGKYLSKLFWRQRQRQSMVLIIWKSGNIPVNQNSEDSLRSFLLEVYRLK